MPGCRKMPSKLYGSADSGLNGQHLVAETVPVHMNIPVKWGCSIYVLQGNDGLRLLDRVSESTVKSSESLCKDSASLNLTSLLGFWFSWSESIEFTGCLWELWCIARMWCVHLCWLLNIDGHWGCRQGCFRWNMFRGSNSGTNDTSIGLS